MDIFFLHMAQYNKWCETGLTLMDHKPVENSNMTCTAFLWFNNNTGLHWTHQTSQTDTLPAAVYQIELGPYDTVISGLFIFIIYANECTEESRLHSAWSRKLILKITLYLISQYCKYCGNIFKAEISKTWTNIHADKTTQLQSPTFVQICRSDSL